LIGPPLSETVKKLVGEHNSMGIDLVMQNFKKYYDSKGCKSSKVYPGVNNMLNLLFSKGVTLYLATNKRFLPTQKIIELLGWSQIFKSIYAIDKYVDRPFANKTEMLSKLLNLELIDPSDTVYIGDRMEDFEAAHSNNLAAILVQWGYGDLGSIDKKLMQTVSSADELTAEIMDFRK